MIQTIYFNTIDYLFEIRLTHRADYQCILIFKMNFLSKNDYDFFNYDFFIHWDSYMNCVTSMKRMDDFLEEYLR